MPEKKNILITGCSSGIGHCVALGLKSRGYRVIATARKMEDVEQLRELGLDALKLDLDDSESIAQAVEQSLELCDGRLYALFNNGAYGQPGAVEDLDPGCAARPIRNQPFRLARTDLSTAAGHAPLERGKDHPEQLGTWAGRIALSGCLQCQQIRP